jgi:hypothetical protein
LLVEEKIELLGGRFSVPGTDLYVLGGVASAAGGLAGCAVPGIAVHVIFYPH